MSQSTTAGHGAAAASDAARGDAAGSPLQKLLTSTAGRTLLVAAAYFATGRLGVLQAIPPGYATAIWPPSGVALAGMLVFGDVVWPGIAIGSFLVNVGTAAPSFTAAALLHSGAIAAWIALGATLQAYAGAVLIRRFVGYPNALDDPRDIAKFLVLGGPVACLINATFAVTGLAATGTIRWQDYPANWGTWWLGDALGAVVITPLVLTIAGSPAGAWRPRRLPVGLPLLGVMALAVVLFVETSAWEQAGLKFAFQDHSDTAREAVQSSLDSSLEVLYSLGSLYAATPDVNRQGFHDFLQRSLSRHPEIKALEWIPRVPASERSNYEAAAHRDGYPGFQITERTPHGVAPAGPRAEYFPVYFVEPYSGNAAALGFDLASDPARRAALVDSAATGRIAATQRVVLVQETGRSYGVLVYLPVYARGVLLTTPEARRDNLRGFALLVLRLQDLMTGALSRHPVSGLNVALYDDSAPGGGALLWQPADAVPPDPHGFTWRAGFTVGGRQWSVRTSQDAGYLARHRPWESWAVLTLTLLFNGLLGALLLIVTGRALKIEARAVRSTEMYERAHYVAETLQHAFLPVSLPSVFGARVDAAYLQGAGETRVGGDWYDVFQLPDGRLALSLGDVVGHGLPAAVVMGQLRQSVRVAAMIDADPAAVLDRAHDQLVSNPDLDSMATAIFAVFDPVTQTLDYASAGHPFAILCTAEGTIKRLTSDGGPLGMEATSTRTTHRAALPPGTLLVLYTDGLVSASHDLPFEEASLNRVVRSAFRRSDAVDHAHVILHEVLHGRAAPDDIAVVTLAVSSAPVERIDLTLPARAGSVRLARQALRQLTARLGVDDAHGQKIGVALSEAVSNAVEHAYGAAVGTVTVRASLEGRWLKVEVEDYGRWRAPRPAEYRGYGIPTMRALTRRVEIDRKATGTAVRFTVSLSPEPAERLVQPRPLPPAGDTAPGSRPVPDGGTPPRTGADAVVMAGAMPFVPAAGAGEYSPASGNGSQGNGSQGDGFRVRRSETGVPIVELPEEVDLGTIHSLRSVLEEAARSDRRAVVVSFDGVAFFDSHAMHTLLRFNRRLEMNRQRLVAVVPAGHPLKVVLHVLEVAPNVAVADTLTEAVEAAQGT